MKITDREFKGLFRRMNNIIINNKKVSVETADNNEDIIKQIKDDDYYMSKPGIIPPRFHYYNHVKSELFGNSGYLYVTQDELDFGLKRTLKISPEERYQLKKSNRFFHKTSSYMLGLSADDWSKGCHDDQCIPECEYYPEYGRIEDSQIIEEHREHERYYRNKNTIVNIDIDETEFKRFLKDHPSIK